MRKLLNENGAEQWDVVVVGAGPAGATTALLLARSGWRVALVDRAEFPRPKPCGDCLSAAAGTVLRRLGLLPCVLEAKPARLVGWRIFSPAGLSFAARFDRIAAAEEVPGSAISLTRDRLDAILRDAALEAGARPFAGYRANDILRAADGRVAGVEVRGGPGRDRRVLRGRVVVGADGLRTVVGRRLGLIRRPPRLRKISLTGHVHGVQEDGEFGEMHLASGACAGLAPVTGSPGRSDADRYSGDEREDTVWNLTLVVNADQFGAALSADPESFYWQAMDRFPALGDRLDGARFAGAAGGRVLLASGPFDQPTRSVSTAGAALVGDAAGYYDPFTGQGIYRALAGAELLAEELDRGLSEAAGPRAALDRYAGRLRRMSREGRWLQHAIEAVTSRPRLCDAAVRHIARAPELATALVASTGDLRPARSLLSPGVVLGSVLAGR